MAYAVDNAQQFNDFLVQEYGFGGTQNEISNFFTSPFLGGNSGTNVANFNDQQSDATISTLGGVTTVDFTDGANAGQDVTLQSVQTVNFLP